jgi:hypothetical protein
MTAIGNPIARPHVNGLHAGIAPRKGG